MNIVSNIKDVIRWIIGEIPTKTLIKRGMKVGKNFNRQQGCFLEPTHCWLISIGNDVTLSIRVTILAHDAATKLVTGYTKIAKVDIGNNVFIGANSTILSGVNIGDNSIIGANSVVTKSIPANSVAVGNPAKVIYTLDEFKYKIDKNFYNSQKFSKKYRMSADLTKDMKKEMIMAATQMGCFIE